MSSLDTLVNELKDAACDAWMRTQSGKFTFFGLGNWVIMDGYYECATETNTETVVRPSGGAGGGYYTNTAAGTGMAGHSDTAHYTSTFNRIRADIDAVIDPWRTLPDADTIGDLLQSCNTACSHLSVDERYQSPAGGTYSSGGELSSAFGTMERNLDGLTGATGQKFAMRYLDRLPTIVTNAAGLAETLSGVMYGQHEIWSAVPTDVRSIVMMGRDQMRHASDGADQPKPYELAVVGFAAEVVKLFVPGAIARAASLGTAAIGAAEKGDVLVETDGGNYDDAFSSFRRAMSSLNSRIRDEEQALRTILYAVIDHAMSQENRDDYDLPDGANDLPQQAGTSQGWDQQKIEAMAGLALPALAAELDAVADNVQQVVSVSHVDREASIGLGASGPHSTVQRFGEFVHDVLEEAAADALDGSVQLYRALSDFQQTESDIVALLNQLNGDLLGARDYGDDLGGDIANVRDDEPDDSPVDVDAAAAETLQRIREIMGG